ncbi:MAG: DNA primase [Clostridioides sp.]|jgi:DNA primase|nr:DNA primase [Clostridioides sp.]
MNDFKEIIEEIKLRCEISQIISEYISISRAGNNYKALCPFHSEKTPSFHINTAKQYYRCFGCGEGGDVISFVMKMENLEFLDAVKLLAKKCGVEINTNFSEEAKQKIEKIRRFQDEYAEAARYYFSNLTKERNMGYDYLVKRGLDNKTIIKFGLGFAKDSWNDMKNYLLEKGYSESELIESGIISKSKNDSTYDRFRNRVIFPIFDYKGNVIAFGGRTLTDSIPKYLNSPDSIIFNKRENLYGLNFARKHIDKKRMLILVEGYMDLISLFQFGIKNVVATLGTALTTQQAHLMKRFADNIVISYDSDQAGVNATLRSIDILVASGLNVKVLNLRDVKDPDEFIRKYGLDEYKKEVDESIEHIKFRIIKLKDKFNLNKDEEKVKYIKESCMIIKKLKSSIDKDYYIKFLSDNMQVQRESLAREVYGNFYNASKKEKMGNYNNSRFEYKSIDKVKINYDGKLLSEYILLKIIDEKIEFRNHILLKVGKDDFSYQENKDIFDFIVNKEKNSIKSKKNDKDKSVISVNFDNIKKLTLNEDNYSTENKVDELIRTVKKNTLENKLEILKNEIAELEKNNKKDTINETKEVEFKIMELASKSMEINKILKNL